MSSGMKPKHEPELSGGRWYACEHPERPYERTLTVFRTACDGCYMALLTASTTNGDDAVTAGRYPDETAIERLDPAHRGTLAGWAERITRRRETGRWTSASRAGGGWCGVRGHPMSARGFMHVNPDGSAVLVTDEGVSAPTEPAIDLTDVVKGLTLDTDDDEDTQ